MSERVLPVIATVCQSVSSSVCPSISSSVNQCVCASECELCGKGQNSYENVERQPRSNVNKSTCHRRGREQGLVNDAPRKPIIIILVGIAIGNDFGQLPCEGTGHPGGHRLVRRQPGIRRRAQVPHVRPVQRGRGLHHALHQLHQGHCPSLPEGVHQEEREVLREIC